MSNRSVEKSTQKLDLHLWEICYRAFQFVTKQSNQRRKVFSTNSAGKVNIHMKETEPQPLPHIKHKD